jgi:glycosyltransferase involved in cell wall biosynthesis
VTVDVPICVVVPTRNRRALVVRALESVIPQLAPGDELLVIDNGSTDDTSAAVARVLAERFEAGRLVSEELRGISYARNRALHEARAPVVAFIDDDERVGPGWLDSLRDAWADGGERVGAIGGPIRADWKAARPEWLTDDLLYVLSVLDLGHERKPLDQRPGTGYLWGGNMSVCRTAALAVGGFRPDVVYLAEVAGEHTRLRLSTARAGEEEDLQNRLAAQGWEIVYEPAVFVDHLIPAERVGESFFFDFYRQQAVLALGHGRPRLPAAYSLLRQIARYIFLRFRREPRATVARFGISGAWTHATARRPRLPSARSADAGPEAPATFEPARDQSSAEAD